MIQFMPKKLVLCMGSLVMVCGCQPATENIEIEFRVPVTVAQAQITNVEDQIVSSGRLRSPELAKLVVRTSGLLMISSQGREQLKEGDRVKAGDLIGSITGDDASFIAVEIQAAKQKLDTARENLRANQELIDKKLIPANQFHETQNEFEAAELAYKRSLKSKRHNAITSPIDGVILKLSRDSNGQRMANGQYVESGDVVAEIGALDSLVADVDLVGDDIAQVAKGQMANISYRALGDEVFSGEVQSVAPAIDESTRTLQAEISVANVDNQLKPGMYVKVTLVVERRETVPVVPRDAITERGGQKVVFVLAGQRVEQRVVKLGIEQGERIEVRDGIQGDEKVVVLGLETLADQMPVHVTDI